MFEADRSPVPSCAPVSLGTLCEVEAVPNGEVAGLLSWSQLQADTWVCQACGPGDKARAELGSVFAWPLLPSTSDPRTRRSERLTGAAPQ